ncbi:MAG: peptide deformylase [Nitrospirae bacterium]|nr:peptide deformylase [Nitrospirota bacterium]
MAKREILKYPHKLLKKVSAPITEIDGEVQTLIDDMLDTLNQDVIGVGLAAPQVGINSRVIVIDGKVVTKTYSEIVVINPVIMYSEGEMESYEGCLSIPEFFSTINRFARIFVKGLDRDGKEIEFEASGHLCRVFQHEIDHLDGILFVDRLTDDQLKIFKKTYRKKR